MQRRVSLQNSLAQVAIVLILGAAVGVLTHVFIEFLFSINSLQNRLNSSTPYHLALIPLVLLLIEYSKKNSLYFPTKVSLLTSETSSRFWTPFMTLFHFMGTLLSHLSGVSVGREGAIVLYSAGLVRLARLSWEFWGPIASSIGFSAVIGNYWVGPVFMLELFGRTSWTQKCYSLLGSLMAVVVMQSLKTESLFGVLDVNALQLDIGFFKKFFVLLFLGVCAGYLMRFYKTLYFYFVQQFAQKSIWLKLLVAVGFVGFLYLPEFRKFQSLGLEQFTNLILLKPSFFDICTKLFLTLMATSVGFFGGEFIPLIFAGTHLGALVFTQWELSPYLGAVLGAYLLFAGGTRFKWSTYLILIGLLGWSWFFWAYFLVSVTVIFSGELSLYKRLSL